MMMASENISNMRAKRKGYFARDVHAAHRPILMVRIDRLVDSPNTHIKAIAAVNLGGWYVVHGLRVVDSQKGLFVQMPQNSFHNKDGKLIYQDIFHPVTAEARTELSSAVLRAYEQKLSEEATQTSVPQYGSYLEIEDLDPDNPFLGEDNDPAPFDMSI